ncbi:hypothetical protein HAX54_009355 [Datura stramonium]|uniref:Uncharacterized protein n=1 Tax=Datura stramonium TaxID=4076 RepID=A0ABS8THI5_DATST|nr:hypothetical protein [Datura stramonium]
MLGGKTSSTGDVIAGLVTIHLSRVKAICCSIGEDEKSFLVHNSTLEISAGVASSMKHDLLVGIIGYNPIPHKPTSKSHRSAHRTAMAVETTIARSAVISSIHYGGFRPSHHGLTAAGKLHL